MSCLEIKVKNNQHPELDLEVIQNLYRFGGLLAYKVVAFSPSTLTTNVELMTFNEDAAKERKSYFDSINVPCGIQEVMIQFDGSFAKNND